MNRNQIEELFWKKMEALPEHKREFDLDVFNVIIDTMTECNALDSEKIGVILDDMQTVLESHLHGGESDEILAELEELLKPI